MASVTAWRFDPLNSLRSPHLSKTNVLNDLLSESYLYDRLNRLVQRIIMGDVSDGLVDQLDMWNYDALGNITSTSRTLQAMPGDTNLDGSVTAQDYIALDANIGEQYAWWRLGDTNWDGTTVAGDYTAVDANLNQTGGGTETLVFRTYNLQNQITAVGSDSLSYDDNGAMTLDNLGQAIAYDAWGRLVEAGGQNYGYDALGRRITITQDTPGTDPAKDLYYSDQWQVLEERESGASVAKRQYVWSTAYVDAMVVRDQDSGTDGTLDERLYVQQDANFNVTALIDTSGTVVERYSYDAFGEFTVLNPDWSTRTGGSDFGWVYLFQGGRYDSVTSLYDFRNRSFDPRLQRWTQSDPLQYIDGSNLYQFVQGDPVSSVDPTGLRHVRIQILLNKKKLPKNFNKDQVQQRLRDIMKKCKCTNPGDSYDVVLGVTPDKPKSPDAPATSWHDQTSPLGWQYDYPGAGMNFSNWDWVPVINWITMARRAYIKHQEAWVSWVDFKDPSTQNTSEIHGYGQTSGGETVFDPSAMDEELKRIFAHSPGTRFDWNQIWANALAHEVLSQGVADLRDGSGEGGIEDGTLVTQQPVSVSPQFCKQFLKKLGLK